MASNEFAFRQIYKITNSVSVIVVQLTKQCQPTAYRLSTQTSSPRGAGIPQMWPLPSLCGSRDFLLSTLWLHQDTLTTWNLIARILSGDMMLNEYVIIYSEIQSQKIFCGILDLKLDLKISFMSRGISGKTLWRHQIGTFTALLALCEENHQPPVDSPHKGQLNGGLCLIDLHQNKLFCKQDASDLRRNHAHYDVIVMILPIW